ncbi:hypothetical protein EX86_14870, partial [Staphylococcus aureus]
KYKPNNPRNKPSKNGILQPNDAICSSVKKNVNTAISVIGFLVITFLHLSTAGKSLKGSYPNVDNEQDRAYYAEHPKEALWWVKERKN